MVSKSLSLKVQKQIKPVPISNFVNAMEKYDCDVTIKLGTSFYNAKSIIGTLASCFNCVSEFELVCSGADEKSALNEAVKILGDAEQI